MASDRVRGNSQEKIVILDTNAILMVFEFSIDLHQELTRLLGLYHLVVPTAVVSELTTFVKKGGGVKAQRAKAALQIVQTMEKKETAGFTGDDAVVHLAQQLHGVVVTNDRALRFRLKEEVIPVIFLRKKQYLCLDEV